MAAEQIARLLAEGQALGLYANVQLAILDLSGRRFTAGLGHATWFDYASLTKPLATGLIAAQMLSEKRLRADHQVSRWFAAFNDAQKANVRISDLLTHRAGLIAYRDWHRHASTAAALQALVAEDALAYMPRHETRYSDAGFILLAAILEKLSGQTLAQQVGERLLNPLDEKEALWTPLPAKLKAICASTGFSSTRGRELQGEVHDENAAILGEHAGHAGLFGTAAACCRLSLAWLRPETTRTLGLNATSLAPFITVPDKGRPWAWDRTGPGPSQAGALAPQDCIGHLGFTGTSLWLSPIMGVAIALLTDRIAHDASGERFRAWRPKLYDAIWPNLARLLAD